MRPSTKKTLSWTAGLLFVVWLGFVAFVDWAMHQPPEAFARVMEHMPMPAYFLFPFETMWTQARAGHVTPGDTAPDFKVKSLETKEPVQLASLWMDKSVVLVFGSYT